MQLRDSIRHNLGLKIFAFLLAVLIWSTLRYMARDSTWPNIGFSRPAKIEFTDLPIHVLTDPANTRTLLLQPSRAAVIVSGRSADVDKLAARDVLVFVDMTGINEDREDAREVKAQCPPGFVVEQINPALVTVSTLSTNSSSAKNLPH